MEFQAHFIRSEKNPWKILAIIGFVLLGIVGAVVLAIDYDCLDGTGGEIDLLPTYPLALATVLQGHHLLSVGGGKEGVTIMTRITVPQ